MTGSAVGVVAGFCNTFDVWVAFERKWKEATKHIPDEKVKKYFRYRPSEFNSPENQRRYRDALVLAEVLRDFTLWPIHTSLEIECFKPIFDECDKSSFPLISCAYSVCSFGCCELLDDVAAKIRLRSQNSPIKVVFDYGNANQRWLDKGYRAYYGQKPDTHLKRIPSFEDDEELIPLKAADAYAWLLGRKYNEGEELEQLKIIHDPRHSIPMELKITSELAKKYFTVIQSASDEKKTDETSE